MQICSVYINSKLDKHDSKTMPSDFKLPFTTVVVGAETDKLKQRYGNYDPTAPIRPMTKEDIKKFGKVRMGRG